MFFVSISTEAYSREQTLIVQKIAAEHNGSDFVFAEDPEAKKELWKVSNVKTDLINQISFSLMVDLMFTT